LHAIIQFYISAKNFIIFIGELSFFFPIAWISVGGGQEFVGKDFAWTVRAIDLLINKYLNRLL